ncbi:hypothetical protein V9T40_004284 [Parthenolecanium corni]|uniref:Uncharacterized protein n=1 Tax=Parthenolecanium corni TaxID=536013 RepID=A0AAN9Y9F3_9HEMI
MGCTGSTNALIPDESKRPLLMTNGVRSNQDLPSSIAFEVPIHDEDEGNLIKKHPPKRLLKLEEQQTSPPVLTHKMLQDKLAEAEQRRMQILHERKESAKILMRPKCANGNTKPIDEAVSASAVPISVHCFGILFVNVNSLLHRRTFIMNNAIPKTENSETIDKKIAKELVENLDLLNETSATVLPDAPIRMINWKIQISASNKLIELQQFR